MSDSSELKSVEDKIKVESIEDLRKLDEERLKLWLIQTYPKACVVDKAKFDQYAGNGRSVCNLPSREVAKNELGDQLGGMVFDEKEALKQIKINMPTESKNDNDKLHVLLTKQIQSIDSLTQTMKETIISQHKSNMDFNKFVGLSASSPQPNSPSDSHSSPPLLISVSAAPTTSAPTSTSTTASYSSSATAPVSSSAAAVSTSSATTVSSSAVTSSAPRYSNISRPRPPSNASTEVRAVLNEVRRRGLIVVDSVR
jgi:hypothetical protein